MTNFWEWVRNNPTRRNAYLDVNSQLGEDLASDPLFAVLREFSESTARPGAIPVDLLRIYAEAQRKARRRNRFRFGSGALFGVIILVPGLAYAGVLPAPIARAVQRVFNVISVPIRIPSAVTPIASSDLLASATGAISSTNDGQLPFAQQELFPDLTAIFAPTDVASDATTSTDQATGHSQDQNSGTAPDSITTIGADLAPINIGAQPSAEGLTTVVSGGLVISTPDPEGTATGEPTPDPSLTPAADPTPDPNVLQPIDPNVIASPDPSSTSIELPVSN
jgi:hypothetical protein